MNHPRDRRMKRVRMTLSLLTMREPSKKKDDGSRDDSVVIEYKATKEKRDC